MKYWGISINNRYTIVSATKPWTAARKGIEILKGCYDNKKIFYVRIESATKNMKEDFDKGNGT